MMDQGPSCIHGVATARRGLPVRDTYNDYKSTAVRTVLYRFLYSLCKRLVSLVTVYAIRYRPTGKGLKAM